MAAPLPQDLPALMAMIQAAIDADRIAQAALVPQALIAPPQPALPPVPVPYAIGPAGNVNQPWDFQTSQGLKLYQAVTAPITPLFDGDEPKLSTFLSDVLTRAECYGLIPILTVNDSQGTPREITHEFGCLTMADVHVRALQYLTVPGRDQQATEMLRILIKKSITPAITN